MQPNRILHYKIENHLGSGAFGDVYQAYDEKLKRYVAIKIAAPNDDESMQKELAARFKLEIGATVKLIHPNIVTVYDAGSTQNSLFYVMAHLPGGDLKKNNNKITSNSAIVQTCIDVAKALAYAHDMGFVHRDIKPENILFDAHGNAVVADFGIVKAMGQDYTVGCYVMGTPSYSAPEQLDPNEDIDGRADLYSLGKVLHFMLAKRKYEADDVEKLPPERAIFFPVLKKLLSTNRDDRFENAHEVLKVFEGLQFEIKQREKDNTVISAKSVKPRKQKSNYKLIIATVLVIVIAAVALIFVNGKQHDGNQPPSVIEVENTVPDVDDQINNADKVIAVATDAIVSITTEPVGADVLLNGELLGTTPFTSETIPVGQQTFILNKRFYKQQSLSFVLESKKIVKKAIYLELGSGGLSIITQPVGARVWIGGVSVVGETPLSIDAVSAGPQTIDIRKGNFSLRRDINIEHNQVIVLRASLEEGTVQTDVSVLPIDSGVISINSNPPGAEVFLDGKKVGVTPFESDNIVEGIHKIKLTHKFYADNVFETEFSAKAPIKRFVELKPGSGNLSVITDPENASIWLDNKRIKGSTPLSLNNILAGHHSIDIRKGELRLQQDIEITNSGTTVVDGKLKAGTLLSFDNRFLTTDELMVAANVTDKTSVKIKMYQAILAKKPEHEGAFAALKKVKDIIVAVLEKFKAKHSYDDARKMALILSKDFEAYFELPDFKTTIDEHEKSFKLAGSKKEFSKRDKEIRSLVKVMHFKEAENLLAKLNDNFKSLDKYKALNKYVENSKASFQQEVLRVTGPLPLVQVKGNDYLRAFAHEVTFSQWDNCFDDGMCSRKPNDFGWGRGNHPVVDVSFEEITAEFIPWINQKSGITFKLPNEAEWQSLYGRNSNISSRHANGPSGFGWGNDSADYTAEVGSYIKNTHGIYDLNGNVWEWVDSCGESSCVRKVLKGGSWNSAPKFFSKEEKWLELPVKRANDIGFRLVENYRWQL